MTTHQTRMVLIPADRDIDELHDIRDHDTASQATGDYYRRARLGQDLPSTSPGDLLYTELSLDGHTVETRWHIAGDDYLLPVTDDQLLNHLGAQLADQTDQYLQAELGPGASH